MNTSLIRVFGAALPVRDGTRVSPSHTANYDPGERWFNDRVYPLYPKYYPSSLWSKCILNVLSYFIYF